MLDYGITILYTLILIDNSSAISIVNNPVKHSKTKHIEIRYHFIRDCNEKKLIQVAKVHTDNQFADLFTKAFDSYCLAQNYTSFNSVSIVNATSAVLVLPVQSQESSSPMASMVFIDEHNEIAMLQKPQQAAGFHPIVDFLKSSHIAHALTVSPPIYIEHQKQFWANTTAVIENGVQCIKTRVCDKPLTVSEEVIRICLRLDDASGITSISNEDLFSNLTRIGYEGQLDVFKFYKANFSPQWPFFVHTLMHRISQKTIGWSQFSSTIAYALVCLSTTRKYNFSRMIFNDLVSNLANKKSFYMYPRFVQAVITSELTDMPQYNEVYVPKIPKAKVFSNMKRSAKDSEGVDTPLFSTMMVVSHNQEGMASGSRPSLDHPTDSQTQPSTTISLSQSLVLKPTPVISKTYSKRKNIHRETTGVSPNPKEVLTKEMHEHVGEKAATTPASTEEASGNITKTFPMELWVSNHPKVPGAKKPKGWRVLLLGRRPLLLQDARILQGWLRYRGDEIGNSVSTSADYQIEEDGDEVGAEKEKKALEGELNTKKENTEAESSKVTETIKLAAEKHKQQEQGYLLKR
ncbi:hypothetical protein L6452_22189 [Arctium lappa]|uniref:Uncharacterized protein n=1 Tax=Arctium lappa TaxID=4217 RepID=A0ACB9AYI7_ARCLA|nr:hypothetical protein L6452_22189 [Arctium lappa]